MGRRSLAMKKFQLGLMGIWIVGTLDVACSSDLPNNKATGHSGGGGAFAVGGAVNSGGAAASGADAGGGESSTISCIGNVTDALSALTPYWINESTACGSLAVSNGTVELVRQGGCANPPSPNQTAAILTLDPSHWSVCGDFDISVDFSLVSFTVPSNQWHAATLRIADPNGSPADIFSSTKTPGMTIEVFSSIWTPHVRYNSYAADTSSSQANVATTDTVGRYRITRVGSLVNAYYWSSGAWSLLNTATLNSAPWTIELYISADSVTSNDVVDFSGLTIASSSTP
jgi:hypothetical protein